MRWGFWEIILIVLLVIILFASAKIPSMMKNVADGVKVFKKEMKTDKKNEKVAPKKTTKKKPAVKKVK